MNGLEPKGVAIIAGWGASAIAARFAGVPFTVLMGAVLGATLFIVLIKNMDWRKQLALFFVATYLGTTNIRLTVVEILNNLLLRTGLTPVADDEVGAFLVSALGVSTLLIASKSISKLMQKRIGGMLDD